MHILEEVINRGIKDLLSRKKFCFNEHANAWTRETKTCSFATKARSTRRDTPWRVYLLTELNGRNRKRELDGNHTENKTM